MNRFAPRLDERLPGLVDPRGILPAQFFSCSQAHSTWISEQCLMAAVLADAR
jgi:hypothetical protein